MPLFFDTEKQQIAVEAQQIFLHPDYQAEHVIKLQFCEEGIASVSPYLDKSTAEQYQVSITKDGHFIDKNGVLLEDGNYLLTMTGDITMDNNLENVIIYASRKDELELTASYSSLPSLLPYVVNHPNFIKGQPVVFSGHMEINETILKGMNNDSGHYKMQLAQCLLALAYVIKAIDTEVLEFKDFSITPISTYHIASDKDYNSFIVSKQNSSIITPHEGLAYGYVQSDSSTPKTRFNSIPLPIGDLHLPRVHSFFQPSLTPVLTHSRASESGFNPESNIILYTSF